MSRHHRAPDREHKQPAARTSVVPRVACMILLGIVGLAVFCVRIQAHDAEGALWWFAEWSVLWLVTMFVVGRR